MESGSVLSEPSIAHHHHHHQHHQQQQQQQQHRGTFSSADRSSSMTVLSTSSVGSSSVGQPRMAQLETLEAKMASIEVSLSSSQPRRRKGLSLGGGNASVRSSPRPESAPVPKETRSALQDREAVIQNLRVQLGLGKLPRPTGTPLEESERPAAEQRLNRLKVDSDNKRIAIRNLKSALDKLDITDNIDVRIRQAELEYALGREELQLLSLVEEAQALQSRLEKSKPDVNTLFSFLQSGISLSLHAVQATVGRWAASAKNDSHGLWIEWALDGEGLYRGDRILEVNGKIMTGKTKEELQKQLGANGKCQLVVIRQKAAPFTQQQLIQSQEDNLRLQHRISYLEEQVKELQECKESVTTSVNNTAHVTSISISSPPVTPPEKPEIFQRGNFITTIVGGKAINGNSLSVIKQPHVTKTIIKETQHHHTNGNSGNSGSSGDISNDQSRHMGENNLRHQYQQQQHHHHHRQQQQMQQQMNNNKLMSSSSISINSDVTHLHKKERERREKEKEIRREARERYIQSQKGPRLSNGNNHQHHGLSYSRSGEHLNYNGMDKRKELLLHEITRRHNGTISSTKSVTTNDLRSVKSLDFDSDYGDRSQSRIQSEVDYTSEPLGPRTRPTPPKKPLRLSLQRAQSLQTVEATILMDLEKKKAMKRTHRGDKTPELMAQLIENSVSLHTSSLGRNKYV